MSADTTETLFACAIRSALDADQLRERLQLALEACAEYRSKLEAAQADTRRLDWMQRRGFEHKHHETGDSMGMEWCVSCEPEELNDIRSAIDAAMQEAAP